MTGSLQIKNNKYYAGKRRQKWIPTNLEVRGNKRKALEILHQLEETYDDKSLQAANLLLAFRTFRKLHHFLPLRFPLQSPCSLPLL